MLKSERAEKAQQTLEYFKKGRYMPDNGNAETDCQSRFTTEFLSEKQLETLVLPNVNLTPHYEVANESVVKTPAAVFWLEKFFKQWRYTLSRRPALFPFS